ncbi:uncharacterized protein LOC121850066 [Callorhinchus milii]|uniref:uncharacterized protein LOC121850066 n=1 Tax=Callorhinchus milii TaxID=7868 RepID=UPI001C3FBD3C|nr:uncharacterized protein LOC121850066 [Callorhinchus milii]
MGSMDEEFQLLPTPQQNGVNLTCKTSKSFSEIWLNSPTDGVRAERKFSSSENAAGDREFAQQVSTEEKGPCETALTPKGLWSDSESVNTTSLPGSGHITTTAATVTTSTPPLLPSPSLSKVDEVLCDSSGSYHTAVCSVTLDNLSDSSGPFEGIEDLPTDSAAESDRAVGLSDINPGSERGPLNIPELGGSFPQCPPGPQCGLPEGDGEGFDDTWERKLCGGAGEWKPCGWNREMESCNSDGGNELRLDSGREEERGTADGNHSSGCEAAPGWLEGGDIGFVDVASDSCSLSVSSNSSGLAAINGTSTKHDPRVGNRRGKESRDQQVQLPISPGNSQTGKGCGGAGDQSLERNPLEQADFHPHPGPQTPQEMSRGDLASEDRRKSYHRTRCERAPPYCVSETSSVDETDREVRRLTSLAFRSLSCPGNGYFDISDCRSSAGLSPSLSEEGNNDTDMWSTYRESGHCPIDSENAGWSYSPSDTARFTSSPESGERNKDMSDDAFDRTQFECVDVMMESQEGKGGKTASRTVPKRQIQLKKRERNKLEVFPPRGDADCPADLGVRPEHANEEMVGRSGNVRDSSTATESARGGAARGKEENNNHKRLPRASCTGDSVTRSKQASCLITNVILKKMQFERGLKMKPGAGRDSIFANVKDSEFCDDASKRVQRQDSSSRSETRVVAENLPDNHGNKSPDVKGIPTTKDVRSMREANPFSDEQSGDDICREKGELRNWKESSQDGQNDRTSGRDPDPTRQRLCPALIPSGSVPAEQEEDNDKLPASQGKRVDCFAQRANRTLETSQSIQSKKLLCYQKTSRVLLSKRKVSDITFTSKSPGIILAPQLVNEKQTDGKSLGSISKAQTLPTLWRTGAEEKQDKLPQSDTGERFSAEGKTKGPIIHHVRDVQKLVRDQRDVLTFTTHESELSEPKSVSLAPSLNHSSHSNQSEPAVRSRALPPIVIECRSISRKTNKDNDTCLSVAEKYWARVEGKHSSKVFSSDLKLPIPSDKHEKRQISICAAISLSRCVTGNKDLAHFSGAKNSERRIQALSISSNSGLESSFTKKRRERNCRHGEEDENTDPTSHELTKETTELRPGKEKQSGLDLLNPVLAKSGATDQDASSFGKVEPNVEFESQLGNQNQKGSTVSSPTEGSSQIISCEGEERREGLRNRQIPSLPSENSTSTAGIVNCSQANDERPKASERKVETEDKPSRISCLENANVETSNGKSIPRSAIEVESENPDELLSKSVIELTSTSPQSDKGIEVITESKSKPFGNLSSNDKETQTSAWKRRHQGDVTVRPEIPRKDVEDGTCDGDDGRALSHTEQEKTEHGVRLEDGNRFLEKSTPNRSNGNLPSIGKAEAERPIVFALDDGSEPGACSVLSSGNDNTSSRIDERETEENSDLHNETLPIGTYGSTCERLSHCLRRIRVMEWPVPIIYWATQFPPRQGTSKMKVRCRLG